MNGYAKPCANVEYALAVEKPNLDDIERAKASTKSFDDARPTFGDGSDFSIKAKQAKQQGKPLVLLFGGKDLLGDFTLQGMAKKGSNDAVYCYVDIDKCTDADLAKYIEKRQLRYTDQCGSKCRVCNGCAELCVADENGIHSTGYQTYYIDSCQNELKQQIEYVKATLSPENTKQLVIPPLPKLSELKGSPPITEAASSGKSAANKEPPKKEDAAQPSSEDAVMKSAGLKEQLCSNLKIENINTIDKQSKRPGRELIGGLKDTQDLQKAINDIWNTWNPLVYESTKLDDQKKLINQQNQIFNALMQDATDTNGAKANDQQLQEQHLLYETIMGRGPMSKDVFYGNGKYKWTNYSAEKATQALNECCNPDKDRSLVKALVPQLIQSSDVPLNLKIQLLQGLENLTKESKNGGVALTGQQYKALLIDVIEKHQHQPLLQAKALEKLTTAFTADSALDARYIDKMVMEAKKKNWKAEYHEELEKAADNWFKKSMPSLKQLKTSQDDLSEIGDAAKLEQLRHQLQSDKAPREKIEVLYRYLSDHALTGEHDQFAAELAYQVKAQNNPWVKLRIGEKLLESTVPIDDKTRQAAIDELANLYMQSNDPSIKAEVAQQLVMELKKRGQSIIFTVQSSKTPALLKSSGQDGIAIDQN